MTMMFFYASVKTAKLVLAILLFLAVPEFGVNGQGCTFESYKPEGNVPCDCSCRETGPGFCGHKDNIWRPLYTLGGCIPKDATSYCDARCTAGMPSCCSHLSPSFLAVEANTTGDESAEQIAVVVLGTLLAVVCIVALLLVLWILVDRSKRRQKRRDSSAAPLQHPSQNNLGPVKHSSHNCGCEQCETFCKECSACSSKENHVDENSTKEPLV